MTLMGNCLARGLRFAAILVTGLMLAGCVIVSEQSLVSPDEAVTPLPDKAYVFGYDEDGTDAVKLSADAAIELDLVGKNYVSTDGTIDVLFIPRGTEGDYLLALRSPDGSSVYGSARIVGDIIAIRVVIGDADPAVAIDARRAVAGGALDGVSAGQGGVSVTTREGLEYLLGMADADILDMGPVLTIVSESPDPALPERLVRDGDFWRAE